MKTFQLQTKAGEFKLIKWNPHDAYKDHYVDLNYKPSGVVVIETKGPVRTERYYPNEQIELCQITNDRIYA